MPAASASAAAKRRCSSRQRSVAPVTAAMASAVFGVARPQAAVPHGEEVRHPVGVLLQQVGLKFIDHQIGIVDVVVDRRQQQDPEPLLVLGQLLPRRPDGLPERGVG